MVSRLMVARTIATMAVLCLPLSGFGAPSASSGTSLASPGGAPATAADGGRTRTRTRAASHDTPSVIPHDLAGRANCISCHGPGGDAPAPEDHELQSHARCLGCHVPFESPRAPLPGENEVPHVTMVTSEYCFSCHQNPTLSMTFPDGSKTKLFIDPAKYLRAMHGRKGMSCTACHQGQTKYPHDVRAVSSAHDLNRQIVRQSCSTCHEAVFRAYEKSVHGRAFVQENNLDVPSCTDCHGIHGEMKNPETALFRLESPDTCTACHGDAKRMAPYKLSTKVGTTYFDDFHGKSLKFERERDPRGQSYKPVCYDCHGIHDIKRVKDPASSVVRENLVKTCARCHKGASVEFPTSWTSHYVPDKDKWPAVYYVNKFYDWVIPGTIGGMGAYILLELIRTFIERVRRAPKS